MGFFTPALEEVGQRVPGDSLNPNRGTIGGRNDWVFSRTYKVNGTEVENYLFKILDPAIRVTDDTVTNAYLVDQRASKLDENNVILTCVFAQIPSAWTKSSYQTVTFPGVLPSSLYSPSDFAFRSSSYSKPTQCRHLYTYFLGPINTTATLPLFQPVDSDGNRVSVISDFTYPSADEYISLTASRGEIVVESIVENFMGDIWARRDLLAVAK